MVHRARAQTQTATNSKNTRTPIHQSNGRSTGTAIGRPLSARAGQRGTNPGCLATVAAVSCTARYTDVTIKLCIDYDGQRLGCENREWQHRLWH